MPPIIHKQVHPGIFTIIAKCDQCGAVHTAEEIKEDDVQATLDLLLEKKDWKFFVRYWREGTETYIGPRLLCPKCKEKAK